MGYPINTFSITEAIPWTKSRRPWSPTIWPKRAARSRHPVLFRFLFVFVACLLSCSPNHPDGNQAALLPEQAKNRTSQADPEQALVRIQAELDKLEQAEWLQQASWSLSVIDENGFPVIERNSRRLLLPASTLKLLTAGRSLASLGASKVFETNVYTDGSISNDTLRGNIYLQGSSDPDFGLTDIHVLAEVLKARGIKVLDGNLITGKSVLGPRWAPGGWEWDDLGNYYAPFCGAFCLDENILTLSFRTPAQTGKATTLIKMVPQIEGLEIENHVITGEPGSGDQAWVYAAPGSATISVYGSLPPGQNSFRIKAAIPDPDLAAAQQLLRVCAWELLGQIRTRQDFPAEKRPLASVESSPLPVILEEMLARSINCHAEFLLRHCNKEMHGGDPEVAAESMLDWLTDLGAESQGCRIVDGSGLSRSNLVSTHFMASSAHLILEQRWGDSLFQILPENGRDGTLRRVLPSFPGRIRAKTGTLEGVRGYAGYLIGESGRRYSFCLLVNHHEDGSTAARMRLDPLLASLICLP